MDALSVRGDDFTHDFHFGSRTGPVYTPRPLCVVKTPWSCVINNLQPRCGDPLSRLSCMLQRGIRAQIHPCSPGRCPSLLPHSPGHRPGDPRPAAAGRSSQAAPSPSESAGPALLDHSATALAPLDRRPGPREARHRHRLAPAGLSSLLALAIPVAGGRPKIGCLAFWGVYSGPRRQGRTGMCLPARV